MKMLSFLLTIVLLGTLYVPFSIAYAQTNCNTHETTFFTKDVYELTQDTSIGIPGRAIVQDGELVTARTIIVPSIVSYQNCVISQVNLVLGDRDVADGTAVGKFLAVHALQYADVDWFIAQANNNTSWNNFYIDATTGAAPWITEGGDYNAGLASLELTSDVAGGTDTVNITGIHNWNSGRTFYPIILKFLSEQEATDTQIFWNDVTLQFVFVNATPTPIPTPSDPTPTPAAGNVGDKFLFGLNLGAEALEDKIGLSIVVWKLVIVLGILILGLIALAKSHVITKVVWTVGVIAFSLAINFFPFWLRIIIGVLVVVVVVLYMNSRRGGYDDAY